MVAILKQYLMRSACSGQDGHLPASCRWPTLIPGLSLILLIHDGRDREPRYGVRSQCAVGYHETVASQRRYESARIDVEQLFERILTAEAVDQKEVDVRLTDSSIYS